MKNKKERIKDWIVITEPKNVHYSDLNNVEVKTKTRRIFRISGSMPVVFGSTMNDGNGIKLLTETGEELYLYQNGQSNYIQSYRKIN